MVSDKIKTLGELTKRLSTKPVLVGGGAVEFYTGGAFTTGDMDIIVRSEEAVPILKDMGFKKEGMYFIKGKLFIHIVSSYFDRRFDDIALRGTDIKIRVIAIEDLIIDRLNACKWWSSETDCEQAVYLIGVYRDRIDLEYLEKRAKDEKVLDLFKNIYDENGPAKKARKKRRAH